MERLALTISPKLEGSPQYAYARQRPLIERLLKRACTHYAIYPELDGARLHWHGTIEIKDERKWFLQVLPTLAVQIGFIKTKPLKTETDNIRWNIYCLKEYAKFRWLLEDHIEETDKYYMHVIPRRLPHRKQPKLVTNDVKTLLDYGFTIE